MTWGIQFGHVRIHYYVISSLRILFEHLLDAIPRTLQFLSLVFFQNKKKAKQNFGVVLAGLNIFSKINITYS